MGLVRRMVRVVGLAGAVVVLFLLVGVAAVDAQGGADVAGTWQGTMQRADKQQRIVVKVEKAAGGWTGVVYNLDDAMAYEGRAATQVSAQGGVLRFEVSSIGAA